MGADGLVAPLLIRDFPGKALNRPAAAPTINSEHNGKIPRTRPGQPESIDLDTSGLQLGIFECLPWVLNSFALLLPCWPRHRGQPTSSILTIVTSSFRIE